MSFIDDTTPDFYKVGTLLLRSSNGRSLGGTLWDC